MTEARQPESRGSLALTNPGRSRSPDAETAAAIALLLASPAPQATAVPAVAAALLPILPAFLLRTPEVAADVAEEAARMALGNLGPGSLEPRFPSAKGIGKVERRARTENLLLRGFFAIAAVRRLAEALRSNPTPAIAGDPLTDALKAERRYLEAHNKARARNLEAAGRIDEAARLYGPLLSWNHGVAGTPADPRPHHLAADGKNFDIRSGPPVETGAWPSVLPGCTCVAGPPRQQAATLSEGR